ncbi:coiled-coil domain-containing protein 177-like [Carcharodon carcharias]|uniref:coiled-coil domain-containing protein 177-like n=1 Tax=Carcharodon carcharias TaxID=13397 RepID=UPI001B7F0E32|nr:coiled-coil domain-containing protein 177-like [Carcharodon carcharias]
MVDPAGNANGEAAVNGAVGGEGEMPGKGGLEAAAVLRQESPMFRLDLDNFNSAEAEGSRYVLTSPRSLEACARCGVRPVELLHKSVNELAKEAPARSMRVAAGLYEVYERERRRKLRDCREERERIIREERRRRICGPVRNSLPSSPAPRTKKTQALDLNRSKSHSMEFLQKKQDSNSTVTSSDSGASSSFSGDTCKDRHSWLKVSPRGRAVTGLHPTMGKSLSLGDLCHSPQTAKKVAKMVRELKKKGHGEVSERDRKIAALMLAKHQEETMMSHQSHRAQVEWETHRRREAMKREMEERERQRALLQCQKMWETRLEARRTKLSQEQKDAVILKQQQSLLQEEKWRLLAGSQELQRKGKLEHAKLEAQEKKMQQEELLRAKELELKMDLEFKDQLLQQKLTLAKQKKVEMEGKQVREKKLSNKVEKLKHEAALKEVVKEMEMERKMLRKSLDQKLAKSQENYEHLMEKRNRELKERATKEELQIRRARTAAEQHEKEHKEHLEVLARAAERKLQNAAQVAQEKINQISRKAVESRTERERIHRLNKIKLEEDEESKRREIQHSIAKKLEKSERIFRERQVALENSRSLARASFQIRDKVRSEINTRTFDKMALEAELHAHLDKK